MNLDSMRQSYLDEGIDFENASARAAQDVVLEMISLSTMADRVTIKGGVVMQHLSHDYRRATLDIDFDFIRYSISDDSIHRFVKALDRSSDTFSIEITRRIEELKHQDYSGKRVHVAIRDTEDTVILTKLDIGVHKDIDLLQTPLYFDFSKLDDGVTLLANSKEQIIAEKMKSLLRIGAASTRFKDVFDIYYLLVEDGVNDERLSSAIGTVIFCDRTMHENNYKDIHTRLSSVFNDRRFTRSLESPKHNWLQLPVNQVTRETLNFFVAL